MLECRKKECENPFDGFARSYCKHLAWRPGMLPCCMQKKHNEWYCKVHMKFQLLDEGPTLPAFAKALFYQVVPYVLNEKTSSTFLMLKMNG